MIYKLYIKNAMFIYYIYIIYNNIYYPDKYLWNNYKVRYHICYICVCLC